tara:strand:+ start:4028 stop:4624 length:597 start_codon:yes stop_codon:yes gene_type:complete
MEEIKSDIEESIAIKRLILDDDVLKNQIINLVDLCEKSLANGYKIIFCGNGGSFGDAQHLSAEFTSRFRFNRGALASVVLGANSSAISAIGNDYGFDNIFSRELEAIGKKGDIFIPITTSGNSSNIISAVNYANSSSIKTICLTGSTGGLLRDLCECLCVPSDKTERIQESHIMIGHILCKMVEERCFPKEAQDFNKS